MMATEIMVRSACRYTADILNAAGFAKEARLVGSIAPKAADYFTCANRALVRCEMPIRMMYYQNRNRHSKIALAQQALGLLRYTLDVASCDESPGEVLGQNLTRFKNLLARAKPSASNPERNDTE